MGSWEPNSKSEKVYIDLWEKHLYSFLTDTKCREIAQNALRDETLRQTWVEKSRPKRQKNPHKKIDDANERIKSPERLNKEQRIRNRVRNKPAGIITRVLEEIKKEDELPDANAVGDKIYHAFRKRYNNNSSLLLADYHEVCTYLDELPNTLVKKNKISGEVVFLQEDDLKKLKNSNVGAHFSAVVKTVPLLGLSLIVRINRKKENEIDYFVSDPLNALELNRFINSMEPRAMFHINAGEKGSEIIGDRWEDEFRVPIGEFDRYVKMALTGDDYESKYSEGVAYTEIARGQQNPFVYLNQLRGNLDALGETVREELQGLTKSIENEQELAEEKQKKKAVKPSIDGMINDSKAT